MLFRTKRYETDRRQTSDTVGEWATYLDRVYYGHVVNPGPSGFIKGYIEKYRFSDLTASRHSANAHQISRTQKLIKADQVEQHAFVFVTAGTFDCRQRGKNISVASGGLYVLNASEPFEVDSSDTSSTSTIVLPSDLCRLTIRGFDDKCCEPGCGEGVLNDAVVGLINGLLRDTAAVDPLWLRDMCCSFVDAALNPRYGPESRRSWRTSETARRLILDAIRQAIRHGLHSEHFRISDAARACQVSPRHIQGILKSVGTTFSQELLAARLHRAAELLRSPARGTRQIAQIANECGFRNHSHFSTRYKECFGVRPSSEIPGHPSMLDAF